MSIGQRGLGRGLDALFENNTAPAAAGRSTDVSSLALDAISPNPDQPRKNFDQQALQELADSIASQGLIQPILVRPARGSATSPGHPATSSTGLYEIVAGERRWRAARLAGLHKIPVYVRALTDEDVMAAALIENLQREDLNPVEEAQGLQSLREQYSLTQEELAKKLGKSRSAIANALRLLQLSGAALADLQEGRLNAGHARALLSIHDALRQEALRAAIVGQNLTVRDAELAVLAWKAGRPFAWELEQALATDKAGQGCAPNIAGLAGQTAEGALGTADAERTAAEHSLSGPDAPQNTDSQGVQDLTALPADLAGPFSDSAPAPTMSPRSKSPEIKSLQTRLTQELALHTRISGTEEKGKITLSYQSPTELAALLHRLGVEQGLPAPDVPAQGTFEAE